jgi:hypothetical protein
MAQNYLVQIDYLDSSIPNFTPTGDAVPILGGRYSLCSLLSYCISFFPLVIYRIIQHRYENDA